MTTTNQRRRRALRAIAPVAGLLAAGLLVWQGSYAAFSATTSNTNDSWASGQLVLTNNGGTTTYQTTTNAIFPSTASTQQNLKPGSTDVKCLTVESTGTMAGALKFYASNLTGDAGLQGAIRLTVDAAPVGAGVNVPAGCGTFPGTGVTNLATNVALSALPNGYAGGTTMSVAAGTQRVAYRFSWTFVSTGTNAGDNALQNKTAGADLTFEIQ